MRNTDNLIIVAALVLFLWMYSRIPKQTVPANFQTLQPPPEPDLEKITANDPHYPLQQLEPPDLPGISYIQAPADPNSGGIYFNPILPPPVAPNYPPTPGYPPQPTPKPPAQPQLANEWQWLSVNQLQNQSNDPNASVTRTPVSLNSPDATGTWSLRGYTSPTYPSISFAGGTPDPSYVGDIDVQISNPLGPTQEIVVYSCTDQCYAQDLVGGMTYHVLTGIKVAIIFDTSLGKVVSTSEQNGMQFDPTKRIDNFVVTDASYFQYSSFCSGNGTYNTQTVPDYVNINGANLLLAPIRATYTNGPYFSELVENATNFVYTQTFILSGLIRSFQIPTSDPAYPILHNRTYLYDQALAIIAAIPNSQTICEEMVLALLQVQDPSTGRFYFSVDSTTGVWPDPYFRVGAAAWCCYALCLYCIHFPAGQYVDDAKTAITAGIAACVAFQSGTGSPQKGLIQLGYGKYVGDTFIPGDQTGASTEHNIDSWFMFNAANIVLPGSGYDTQQSTIHDALITTVWGTNIYGIPVFSQGIDATGVVDTADALDINSWGGLWWIAQTDVDATANATLCLQNAQAFFWDGGFVSGYAPYVSTRGYPGAIENVWSEGTAGVALLYSRLSQETQFNRTIDNEIYLRQSNGGWQYAFFYDTLNQVANWPGVSGTAWSLFVLTSSLKSSIMNRLT